MKKTILFLSVLLLVFFTNITNAQTIPDGWNNGTNFEILHPQNPNHANPNGTTPHSDQWLGYGTWTPNTTSGQLQTPLLDVSKLPNGKLNVDLAYNEYFAQFMDFGIIAVSSSVQKTLWTSSYNGLTYLNWRTVNLDLSEYAGKDVRLIFAFNAGNNGDLVIVDVGKMVATGAFGTGGSGGTNTLPVFTWKTLTSYTIWKGGAKPVFTPYTSYSVYDAEDGDLTNDVVIYGLEDVDVNTIGKYTVVFVVSDKDGGVTVKVVSIQIVGLTSVEDETGIPTEYSLSQNYPNPFNPSTKIKFSTLESGFVSLKVYDVLGKEVANLVDEQISAGNHSVNFDASRLPSGMYIYRITADDKFVQAKKMILMK